MAQPNKGTTKKPSIFARFAAYLKNVRTELRRVVWPTRKEVLNSSVIVVITLVFFIFFTLIVDSLSSWILIDGLAAIGR
jgi:preprotein translocase subunit SecE